MNADRLLGHYERIADAPDAIARLRRFILDLAVRGKLVEQDPEDEPAAEVLERIAAEKARLFKAELIKRPKQLEAVERDEIEFCIPPSWCWTRLGKVTSYIQRGKSPKYASADGPPVVSQKCVQWHGLSLDKARKITYQSLVTYEDIRFLRKGDLLWNSTGTGTIGRVIRLIDPPERLVCDSHVTVVRCLFVSSEYIRTWLRTGNVYGLIEERAAGSTNQVELTAQMALNQVVPLPPLAEQHHIVAKVDELMALCDRLEAARTEREAMRDRMGAASLIRLNDPDPDPVVFRNHAAFAIENLAPLTTRRDQIKALRQTILNLAVRGKLVPQDPNDEPASELVKRAKMTKAEATIERKIRKNREHELSESAGENGSPIHWVWAYIHDFALVLGGKRLPSDASFSPEQTGNIYIRVADMKDGSISAEDLQYISNDVRARIAKYTIDREDLYITIAGTIGEVGEVPEPFHGQNLTENAAKIVFREVDRKFLLLVLQSEDVQEQFQEKTKQMAQPKLALKRISGVRIPLPPLAEQHRIVAKVDELMVLCELIGYTRVSKA